MVRYVFAFFCTAVLFGGLFSAFRALDRSTARALAAEHKLSQCDEYVSGREEPMPGSLIWFRQTGEIRIQVGNSWLGTSLSKEGAEKLSRELDAYIGGHGLDAGADGGTWL